MAGSAFDFVGLEFLRAREVKLQHSLDTAIDRVLTQQREFILTTDPTLYGRRKVGLLRAARWIGKLKAERNKCRAEIARRERALMRGGR